MSQEPETPEPHMAASTPGKDGTPPGRRPGLNALLQRSFETHRSRWLIGSACVLVLLIALTVAAVVSERQARQVAEWSIKGDLKTSGGRFAKREILLKVPLLSQNAAEWSDDLLGPTTGTLGAEGCAVSSAAMVLASYGLETDPGKLNRFLMEVSGYTPEGWIMWEKAAELAPDKVEFVYEDLPSYWLIDDNLRQGNPVIVRVRFPERKQKHFVVIAGKRGYDYLIADPGAGRGIYPFKELNCTIEALRFYRKKPRDPKEPPPGLMRSGQPPPAASTPTPAPSSSPAPAGGN